MKVNDIISVERKSRIDSVSGIYGVIFIEGIKETTEGVFEIF